MLLLRGKSTYPTCSDFPNQLFALAVNDRGGWAGFRACLFTGGNVQRFMDAAQRPAAIQHAPRRLKKGLWTGPARL